MSLPATFLSLSIISIGLNILSGISTPQPAAVSSMKKIQYTHTYVLDVSNTLQINMIDEVKLDDTRNKEIYSMVIYFVKPGDTLWNIAKKLGSTVSDIVRVNKIEDENKIYPGQQLFVPKYVYTKREITA